MGNRTPVLACVVPILLGGALGPGYWVHARYIAGDGMTSYDAFSTQGGGGSAGIGPVNAGGSDFV
jgi:hypothetical protein